MDNTALIEIFGYIGSAMVVISMLMSSIIKLRIINTAGSVISGAYAVICGALPLALMNACLIVINGYNLVKLLKSKQSYDLVSGTADDAMAGYFLRRYEKDILKYFPEFRREEISGKEIFTVCCDGTAAGIMVGKRNGEFFDVLLDYSTPVYRDCSVGTYLYSRLPEQGIDTLRFSETGSGEHASYLKKMGFVSENGSYVKNLK